MNKHPYNVESFNLDHTLVTAPYVRRAACKQGPAGDIVSKYDIRFCQPNAEFMTTGAIHTLEHLTAEYIRDEITGVIDFSPMGCRTGFYLTVFGDVSEQDIAKHMLTVMEKVAAWPDTIPVPGVDPAECGNYRDHDLTAARSWAKKWIEGIQSSGWACIKDSR